MRPMILTGTVSPSGSSGSSDVRSNLYFTSCVEYEIGPSVSTGIVFCTSTVGITMAWGSHSAGSVS